MLRTCVAKDVLKKSILAALILSDYSFFMEERDNMTYSGCVSQFINQMPRQMYVNITQHSALYGVIKHNALLGHHC